MRLQDDYVLMAAAAIIAAAVVILATLLTRYARLVREGDRSTRLAKDVWDSMNSRLSIVDGRIIDLMARTEVLSSRLGGGHITSHDVRDVSQSPMASTSFANSETRVANRASDVKLSQPSSVMDRATETETKVLQLLAEGSKSSAEITGHVRKSREHVARLMKSLFERGLVVRNDRNKPYVYEITERGKFYVAS
jgi:predicted transcriptional regulator